MTLIGKKNVLLSLLLVVFSQNVFGSASAPDSAYLFSYATNENGGRNGLHFAWSLDSENWHAIGPYHSYLRCDYGAWGAEKRMYSPFLFQDPGGLWHCVWSVNERDGAFAHTTSINLIDWQPQSYPVVIAGKNCLQPEIFYDSSAQHYIVSWKSDSGDVEEFYSVFTQNFKNFSAAQLVDESDRLNLRVKIRIGDNFEAGTLHHVSWSLVEDLLEAQLLAAYNNLLNRETTDDDPVRFKDLTPVVATITVNGNEKKKISDKLIGIFFEDINYAADGGLYAELVQNRGFEYSLHDKKGSDPGWNSLKAWSVSGSNGTVSIDTLRPVHKNNKHYAILKIDKVGAGLVNEGFDGIPLQAGEKYHFSVLARNQDDRNKKVSIRLVGKNNEIISAASINLSSTEWKKCEAVLKSEKTMPDARLVIVPQAEGQIALDMISLFPQNTFNGRKNGLRADLAQVIADIHPRFVRFPGGCVAHGDGLENIYHWKNTIGPLESRKPQRNIWGYHQSGGLGYFEYFQFCEDIGAEPVPIVAAGVPCQNSSDGGAGQQGGIPMCEMENYVQDVLDLIEWANGDKNTEWGKKRAEAGHPEPFKLKYLGVGNEDLITEIFKERFTMIYNAVKEKYPDITVIGTVGPFYQGSDYEEGWRFATQLGLAMVDEHYYQPPGWFIHNQDFYEKYDRSKSKVYLGEYAGHLPGRPNNMETALSEALYLTAVERNGDVVSMASYAPLLAKEDFTQWNPDLIYFNNTEVKPTVGYYVQKLYGQNAGDVYISSRVSLSENREEVRRRVAVSVVRDSETGDLILKMINMLPVVVNAHVKMDGIADMGSSAVQTVLTGDPDDINAQPVTSDIVVNEDFEIILPGYSFTLVRIMAGEMP
ncbi:carbohydrate binding domain-containing protein [candidate division KSB1 bacterium]|nr:carbohydrate binding domain-containing protein [candidate division KSB1 bacterium]